MSGRKLLFVHAFLGTLLIFAVQHAEGIAEQSHIAVTWLKYILFVLIFMVLLVLDWFAHVLQEWVGEKRARSLTEAGQIEGCWLEASWLAGEKADYDLGAFITIAYMPQTHVFRVEGEVFGPTGERYGHFEGHGWPDPLGTMLLYDYHANHGGKKDDGVGSFTFRQIQNQQATQFGGSFHGTTTKIVRLVNGTRTESPSAYLSADELLHEKRKKIVVHLAQSNKAVVAGAGGG